MAVPEHRLHAHSRGASTLIAFSLRHTSPRVVYTGEIPPTLRVFRTLNELRLRNSMEASVMQRAYDDGGRSRYCTHTHTQELISGIHMATHTHMRERAIHTLIVRIPCRSRGTRKAYRPYELEYAPSNGYTHTVTTHTQCRRRNTHLECVNLLSQ